MLSYLGVDFPKVHDPAAVFVATIGRALQEHVIRRARELGCYQVRSVSGAEHPANRQLKLAMGFAVEPMERDKPTLAFVMPLRPR